jgi:hypothetical protein
MTNLSENERNGIYINTAYVNIEEVYHWKDKYQRLYNFISQAGLCWLEGVCCEFENAQLRGEEYDLDAEIERWECQIPYSHWPR